MKSDIEARAERDLRLVTGEQRPGNARHEGPSDDALALAFSERQLKGNARYVAPWHRWVLWDGARWRTDERLQHMTMLREFLREEATQYGQPKMVRTLRSDNTRAAVERMARSNSELSATTDQWDANPWLLGTPGGTVDLRTGELRKPRREDYITKQTAVTPEKRKAPLWNAFLARVFRSAPSIPPFLQRAAGYALTGMTTEHKLLFSWGQGRNGKGVHNNTLAGVMGDYAVAAPASMFLDTAQQQHPTDLALLAGARLVTASELPPGRAWDEARIKALTGGDPVTARRMRQDFFTYQPQFTLMISGNHMPSFRGVDEAIRARVLMIPFSEVIPAHERDPDLAEKLQDEWPAILQWAIEGAQLWREYGLYAPPEVEGASADYLEDEDFIGQFTSQSLEEDMSGFVPMRELYEVFRGWCDAQGMRSPWTQRALTTVLKERGYVIKRRKTGNGVSGYSLAETDAYKNMRGCR